MFDLETIQMFVRCLLASFIVLWYVGILKMRIAGLELKIVNKEMDEHLSKYKGKQIGMNATRCRKIKCEENLYAAYYLRGFMVIFIYITALLLFLSIYYLPIFFD